VSAGRPTVARTAVVLRALGLGDLLTAVPALRALREGLPEHRLVLATSGWLAPLVEHLGLVDELLPARELEPVACERPDLAVNLHGRGPQSTRLLAELRPERLVAFAHPDVPETAGMPAWCAGEHEVRRWCRLVTAAGFPADPADLDIAPPAPEGMAASVQGATVIHPGASSPARRWPVERWVALARAELARGRAVAITGSHTEVPLASAIADRAGLGPETVVAGRTDVLELAAVVAAAGRVVTGDTGVAHLATAVGTPSVVLFGPVPPSEWGPPPERHRHRALWAGRRGDPHAATPDAGLLEIGVDDVVTALETV
jgi:ADP-heptose:LPS heptosyltransferase